MLDRCSQTWALQPLPTPQAFTITQYNATRIYWRVRFIMFYSIKLRIIDYYKYLLKKLHENLYNKHFLYILCYYSPWYMITIWSRVPQYVYADCFELKLSIPNNLISLEVILFSGHTSNKCKAYFGCYLQLQTKLWSQITYLLSTRRLLSNRVYAFTKFDIASVRLNWVDKINKLQYYVARI